MSTTTVAQFRADFPEFGDAAAYPDTQVQRQLDLAELRLNPDRWDALWSYGVELYTAHNLALSKLRARTALTGGAPGATTGIVTSKSVGGVSKSSDIGVATVSGAGTYNLTSYGSEYWQLAQQIGIGGVQVGGGGGVGEAAFELGSFGIVPFSPY